MERLARDPHYFARPDRALLQDIRRYFPITAQAPEWPCWRSPEGVAAAVTFIEEQIGGGSARRRDRPLPGDHTQGEAVPAHTPPEREYCPSHQHLEREPVAA